MCSFLYLKTKQATLKVVLLLTDCMIAGQKWCSHTNLSLQLHSFSLRAAIIQPAFNEGMHNGSCWICACADNWFCTRFSNAKKWYSFWCSYVPHLSAIHQGKGQDYVNMLSCWAIDCINQNGQGLDHWFCVGSFMILF